MKDSPEEMLEKMAAKIAAKKKDPAIASHPELLALLDQQEDEVNKHLNKFDESAEAGRGDTIGFLIDQKSTFQAAAAEMEKWRTTMLVALNSGAIVALLDPEKSRGGMLQTSILMFLLGVSFAVASGGFTEQASRHGLRLVSMLERIEAGKIRNTDGAQKRVSGFHADYNQAKGRVDQFRSASLLIFMFGVILAVLS